MSVSCCVRVNGTHLWEYLWANRVLQVFEWLYPDFIRLAVHSAEVCNFHLTHSNIHEVRASCDVSLCTSSMYTTQITYWMLVRTYVLHGMKNYRCTAHASLSVLSNLTLTMRLLHLFCAS